MSADNVKSAERVLRILEFLARSPGGCRPTAVSRALSIPISSCVGLLGTMRNEGFVTFDEVNRTYLLTNKLQRLEPARAPTNPLQDMAIRSARQMYRELGTPVGVSRRSGLFIEWDFTLGRTYVYPGSSMPIFKTFAGLAALSHMSEAKLHGIVEAYNERFGREVSVHSPDVVKRLHSFRGRDYISGGPPAFPGLGCICFYLKDEDTEEEVLLTLQMPLNELADREPSVVRAVRKCVSALKLPTEARATAV